MAVMFGQFINHDLENGDQENYFAFRSEVENLFAQDLLVPDLTGDDFCFFPPGVPRCQEENAPYFIEYRPSAGVIQNGQFEVTNRVTSFLDLSPTYGSNKETATVLRTGTDGTLLSEDYSGQSRGTPFSFSDLPPPSLSGSHLNSDIMSASFS